MVSEPKVTHVATSYGERDPIMVYVYNFHCHDMTHAFVSVHRPTCETDRRRRDVITDGTVVLSSHLCECCLVVQV
jgi:hypothetical protein